VAGGYVIRGKFDEISQEQPISVVISAINDLCQLLKQNATQQELQELDNQLVTVFGSYLSSLARVLPNIHTLIPNLNTSSLNTESDSNSVYFVLQLFMRAVSSNTRPVLLFLDDLQWADT
jgi:predicted ATPase